MCLIFGKMNFHDISTQSITSDELWGGRRGFRWMMAQPTANWQLLRLTKRTLHPFRIYCNVCKEKWQISGRKCRLVQSRRKRPTGRRGGLLAITLDLGRPGLHKSFLSAPIKKKKKATSLGFTPQQPPQRAARSGGPRLQRGFQGLLLQLKESACSYNKIKEINWNWMTGPPGKCDCNYRTRPPVKDTFFPFAPGWYGGFSFEPICHWKQIKKNLRQSAMFFMGF